VTGRFAVLMTADTVSGVWPYALGLCASLPEIDFILATLGPPPRQGQLAALARLANITLAESDFLLEWMAGGQADIAASRRWLDALADRHAVDLVHVNGYAQARLDGARPVVAVAHSDVLSWWMAVNGEAVPPEWNEYRRQVVHGLDAAARVVTPTKAVCEDLRRQYRLPLRNAMVIPNGIDVGIFSPQPKRPVIMAAGRVWDAAKNLWLLDDVAQQVAWPIEIAGEVAHPSMVSPGCAMHGRSACLLRLSCARGSSKRRSLQRRVFTSLSASASWKRPQPAARWCSVTSPRRAKTGKAPRFSCRLTIAANGKRLSTS
jgi:glycogen synthase